LNEKSYPLQFGKETEDRTRLRMENKMTPKWAWPESRDPISKFWDTE